MISLSRFALRSIAALPSPSRVAIVPSTARWSSSSVTSPETVTTSLPASPESTVETSSESQPSVEELRLQAIKLYKELHRLGRDYPDAEYDFNKRLRRAFEKNSKITDPEQLKKQLELGEHIKKEVLAMLSLKKFRHLRRTYHPNEGPR